MLTLPASVRIYVAAEPVDLRRGFDGLAAAARAVMGADPVSGHREAGCALHGSHLSRPLSSSYRLRASRTASCSDTSATGTSHHDS